MNSLSSYIVSLAIVLLCLTVVPHASAVNSFVLGSRHNPFNTYYIPPNLPYWQLIDEHDAMVAISGTIASDSSIAGYNAYNWYGSALTTDANILQAAVGYEPQESIVFYIGEGDNPSNCLHYFSWFPFVSIDQQYCIVTDNGNEANLSGPNSYDWFYDSSIYPNTTAQRTIFAFLWSCLQGDIVGDIQYSGYEHGMPYAWLHTSLRSDGYGNSDTSYRAFIGFSGSAPKLAYSNPQFYPGAVSSFLSSFYYAALIHGANTSISQALDYAARATWGPSVDFSNCILRTGYILAGEQGNMVIYGDGNMHISDYSPPDVAITNVSSLKTAVGQGYRMNVSVTAANQGIFSWDTFNVTAYATNTTGYTTAIQTQSLTLAPGNSANLTFTWNATLPYGNYSTSAYAWPLPNEEITANNNCTGGMVALTIPGDITGPNNIPDYIVNGRDLNALLAAYGGKSDGSGPRPYNPNADINNDGIINGPDLNILLSHYGQHYP